MFLSLTLGTHTLASVSIVGTLELKKLACRHKLALIALLRVFLH
ncbi:hypothetical protein VCRA2119O147_1090011 [Vibrio crassostreae]|nr:hypothetical protein VCRA2119O147_1090011 [Vibrio crassostreae]CAK2969519.1 hypothetical protein VCRA2110O183_500011 [Vibrio crassostreae]CAK3003842.1 hypothetical protein VCRA2121O264_480010 [Vibrio crassostreae]CAK3711990.1 hypothetical protein VCRA2121O262_500003 [Vibrio crassostreae]